MGTFLRPNYSFLSSRIIQILIVFLWIFGLFLGAFFAYFCFGSLSSYIYLAAVGNELSVVGLLFARLLPFFLTITAFCFSKFTLFASIVFLKAFLFSFTSTSIAYIAGLSAWLVCTLLLFSEVFALLLLWLVWIKSFTGDRTVVLRRAACAILGATFFSLVDFVHIAPLLRRLVLL